MSPISSHKILRNTLLRLLKYASNLSSKGYPRASLPTYKSLTKSIKKACVPLLAIGGFSLNASVLDICFFGIKQ